MDVESSPVPDISTNHKSEEVSTNHVEDPVTPDISTKKAEVAAEKISTNHSKDDEPETEPSTNHKGADENHSNGKIEEATNHIEPQDGVKEELTNNVAEVEKENVVSTNHTEADEDEEEEEVDPLSTNGEPVPKNLQPMVENCVTVLIDIAGTSSPMNFIKETLFCHIIGNAERFLRSNWETEPLKSSFPLRNIEEAIRFVIEETKDEMTGRIPEDGEEKANVGIEDKAQAVGLLKKVQGMILREGYEKGKLEAKLFPDVAPAIRDWSKMGRRVSVYSTGSVEAQKLLFSHAKLSESEASEGKKEVEAEQDAPSKYIEEYLDTENVGPKTKASSYRKILDVIRSGPEETMFITDDIAEAKAAKTAGLFVFLIERKGNPILPDDHGFPVIESFKEIFFKTRKEAADKTVQTVTVAEEKKEAPPSSVKEADQPAAAIKNGEEMEKTEPTEELSKDSKSDEKTEVKEDETLKEKEEKMDEDEESRKRKREEVEEKGKEEPKEEKRKREEEKGAKVDGEEEKV